METAIDDPERFFNELGDLHDARIVALQVDESTNSLSLSIDDLNINSRGWPGYEGLKPARIVMRGLLSTHINVDEDLSEKGIWIFSFDVSPRTENAGYDVSITTSPGGKIEVGCKEILIDTE